MEHHGQDDGVDEHHVLPQWEGQEGFAGGKAVHGVQHFNDNKDR